MLITRPEHDYPTAYFSLWSKEIITFAASRGINHIDLNGKKAVRKNLESYLSTHTPRLVIFNGHGNETCICGHNNEPLIILGDNEDMLNSAIVYTIACGAAKVLGLSCVEKGSRAFIGYLDEFSFYSNKHSQSKPLNDETARPCFEASNALPLALLKGKTVKEAVNTCLEEYRSWIRIYLHRNDIEAPYVLRCLIWDHAHLVTIGDHEATIDN